MKKITLAAAFVSALAAPLMISCGKQPQVSPEAPVLSIDPLITRATEVNFEDGDRIGLTVTRADGSVYAENALLSYSDGVFSGELKWYDDGGESSALAAYYPYSESGFPQSFEVGTDQKAGAGAYDLMLATKSSVKPQEAAVTMAFRHQLSQIVMNVKNDAGISIDGITLKGLLYRCVLSEDGTEFVPDESAGLKDIIMEEVSKGVKYRAIVVPQTIAFGVGIKTASGGSVVKDFTEVTMKPGYSYRIEAEVLADGVRFSLSGEIDAWEDGGEIAPDEDPDPTPDPDPDPDPTPVEGFEEYDGYFIYNGETYRTVTLKDGKTWMAENLRVIPSGLTPTDDLGNVTAGIYYPIVINDDHTAAVQTRDASVIKSNGYLYQMETALGLAVGDLKTEDQAKALEGAQGICPPGWHVPTVDDLYNLVGRIASYDKAINTAAPYYDSTQGGALMSLINADGFNVGAYGAVTVQNNQSASANLMGFLKNYTSEVASGYICGSSFASLTEKDGVITNFQFYSLMPMKNNGTINGAKQSYRIAAPVRCVKN